MSKLLRFWRWTNKIQYTVGDHYSVVEGLFACYRCQSYVKEETMRKFLILAVAALLFASACQKTEENPPPAAAPEASAPAAPASPAAAPSAAP